MLATDFGWETLNDLEFYSLIRINLCVNQRTTLPQERTESGSQIWRFLKTPNSVHFCFDSIVFGGVELKSNWYNGEMSPIGIWVVLQN